MTQTKTEFFESVVADKNVAASQLVIFFTQAYHENKKDPDEQLRLFDLLTKHRPELEEQAAMSIIGR